ncbi:MAG TPA: CvpA family protein [Candidatus Limnocylindrales bacterium]|nr:CvpA family protein [Candidatus Limnocylindrales bacterium]
MNVLDLAILGILLVNIMLGYAFGVIRRGIALLGVFAGVGGATLTSANTSTYLSGWLASNSVLWAHVVTYAIIVVAVVVLFEVLGAVYQRWINQLMAPLFDRALGILGGFVVGALEVTLMLIVGVGLVKTNLPAGYVYPPAFYTMQQLFYGSLLAPHFYGLEPLTRAIFSMVLPGDLANYFTQLLPH